MQIHVLQHVAYEGPGAIATWTANRGHTLQIVRLDAGEPLPRLYEIDVLIVLGGPMSVHDTPPYLAAERRLIEACLLAGRPTLGICLGMQQMALCLGAQVSVQRHAEIGWWSVAPEVLPQGPRLPAPLPDAVFHWHSEGCTLPQNTRLLARSAATPVQAFAYGRHGVGLQFHPEATPEWIAQLRAGSSDSLSQTSPYVASGGDLVGSPAQFAASHAYLYALLDMLADLPRTNYRRIDCGYYDHIELSILRQTRRAVRIQTLTAPIELPDALLLDTRTMRGEEFVRVATMGWMRADRIELVGVAADGACRV